MDPPTCSAKFEFTAQQLEEHGLSGDALSQPAKQVIETMKAHPELLKLSLFALQCVNTVGHQSKPGPPTVSDTPTVASGQSVLTPTSNMPEIFAEYTPNEHENSSYYNGITSGDDHPVLIYRSDFTTPFPGPTGNFGHIPTKSLHGVFDTPLNRLWDTVGPKIRDLINVHKIQWSSIDPAQFVTRTSPSEEGVLGPVVVWIGVRPGSTSSHTAHAVSQEILALLSKSGAKDAVVEWREATRQIL